MTLRYGYRCDICGAYHEVGWTSDLDYVPGNIPRPEGWLRIRLFVNEGPDMIADKDVCPDCGEALREGKPAVNDWLGRSLGDIRAVPYSSNRTYIGPDRRVHVMPSDPMSPPVVSEYREADE